MAEVRWSESQVAEFAVAAGALRIPYDSVLKKKFGISYLKWYQTEVSQDEDAQKKFQELTTAIGSVLRGLIHERTAPITE